MLFEYPVDSGYVRMYPNRFVKMPSRVPGLGNNFQSTLHLLRNQSQNLLAHSQWRPSEMPIYNRYLHSLSSSSTAVHPLTYVMDGDECYGSLHLVCRAPTMRVGDREDDPLASMVKERTVVAQMNEDGWARVGVRVGQEDTELRSDVNFRYPDFATEHKIQMSFPVGGYWMAALSFYTR